MPESPAKRLSNRPVLLSGGNPQIAKADGDAAVQSYINALTGWKQDLVRQLDDAIAKAVPGVDKAIRWNSPMYGMKGNGWFISLHVFTRYVKVTFFKGSSLVPPPAGGQAKEARWVDLREGESVEAQLLEWVKQASAMPGWGKH